MEQVIIDTLSDFDIPAHTEPGLAGVWTAGGQISRGIAFHGFALNVTTDLSYYRHIVPCGITDRPVTSMREELEMAVEMEAVRDGVVQEFGRAMKLTMAEANCIEDPTDDKAGLISTLWYRLPAR